MTTTILVGREKSINGIEEARLHNFPIFAVTQVNHDVDEFDEKSINKTGTICQIIDAIRTPEGTLKVIIQGLTRARLLKVIPSDKFFSCEVAVLVDELTKIDSDRQEVVGLIKSCIDSFSKYAEYNRRITPEILSSISKFSSPIDSIYPIATYVGSSIASKQEILDEDNAIKRLRRILKITRLEIEIAQAEDRINKSVQEKFIKSQKEIYLNEQLKNIKKELGHDEKAEIKEIEDKLAKLKLPIEVKKKCDTELSKMEKMNPYSSESGVVRNYLDWICSLPWSDKTKSTTSLDKAKKILDKHHYGLEKVKDRIIEFIAVQIKTKDAKGPILCLVGAPGVGKTSLAKSIAEAVGRKYVKVSLGGVRDESEIRGHRRTYIGSMPGRIIQSMRKVHTINPLMLLDEIDKMSHDFRGDPSSAMLEVLDPEQNSSFSDHYLEVDYDLSKVMFVATANSLNTIPAPLRDRMEIIKLSGYTENEKLHIAKEHLIKDQLVENGLSKAEFSIDDEAVLILIRNYTFEAGVRNLNREIANLARKATKEIILKNLKSLHISEKNLHKYSGVKKRHYGIAKEQDLIGVTTGLAYTEYGGDLLDIEALKFDGVGKIQITGQLGDVMKESAHAALSYARSIASELKIDSKKFNKYDFHLHVPEGATPKDGPSAGVAICVSLVSILGDFPIRKEIAMTGEITLTGKVLEIGGLKEKLLAALRGGIKTVLIPEANRKDIEEIPKEVLDQIEIKPIKHVREALDECLIRGDEKTKGGRRVGK